MRAEAAATAARASEAGHGGGGRARGDAGRVRIGLLLGLALLAVAAYGGLQLAKHYWAYWNLGEEANRVATDLVAGQVREEGARQTIRLRAADHGIHFEDKDIQITIEPRAATVAFAWETAVNLPWYTFPLSFQVNATSRRTR